MEDTLDGLLEVKLFNGNSYPIRVLTYLDEETLKSTYKVLKQFESINIVINKLTYEHIVRNPKVTMLVDPQD
jgi:hypothetical protein